MTAIANAGGGTTIDSSSNLHVASIKAGSAVPSEAGASAFVDLEAQNLRVSRVRAPANTALVLEGATVGEAVSIDASGLVTISTQANCSHILTVKGGRGGTLTGGAMLRIVSDAGTLLNTPPAASIYQRLNTTGRAARIFSELLALLPGPKLRG